MPATATQERNSAQVALLSGDVQMRYEPNFHWKSAAASFMALPALRGFWPMSGIGVSGQAIDMQGLGNHLTRNGDPEFGYDNLAPYCEYDGTGDYHSITDAASSNAFDILGTESYIKYAYRGLTCGAWVYPTETGTVEDIMSKSGAVGAISYRIYIDAADQWSFTISDDGTNETIATYATAIPTFNSWYFVVGRFIPSASVDIFVNGVETNQPTARASIFNSSADFMIAAYSIVISEFAGRISFPFICAAQLSNSIIKALFEQTKAMFGVL